MIIESVLGTVTLLTNSVNFSRFIDSLIWSFNILGNDYFLYNLTNWIWKLKNICYKIIKIIQLLFDVINRGTFLFVDRMLGTEGME